MKTKRVRLVGSIALMVAGAAVFAVGFRSSLPGLLMGIGFFLVVAGFIWLM